MTKHGLVTQGRVLSYPKEVNMSEGKLLVVLDPASVLSDEEIREAMASSLEDIISNAVSEIVNLGLNRGLSKKSTCKILHDTMAKLDPRLAQR